MSKVLALGAPTSLSFTTNQPHVLFHVLLCCHAMLPNNTTHSQYYTAFRDTRARDLALRCFRAMDAAWHNSTLGGYDEPPASSIPPLPTESVAAKPTRRSSAKKQVAAAAVEKDSDGSGNSGASSKASAVRVHSSGGQESAARRSAITQQQQQEEPQQVRTLNVAMHGLEALTALHKVTKGKIKLFLCSRGPAGTRCFSPLSLVCRGVNTAVQQHLCHADEQLRPTFCLSIQTCRTQTRPSCVV